ncbi:hypothetical protein [uncultured Kordia sp.]|uniref:hypothetical protein n=1 Tax=uncultured Kordia sp. TaxID=507699 RepID=UPI002619CC2F|nr:hypothetical protein [uncultured Kordia sp.]
MQKIAIILLFFISSQVFGQRDLKITIADFNNDMVDDTLKTFYEGGSGFGGRYVQMTNGKTNERFELTNNGCSCEIKRMVLMTPALAKSENQLFLKELKAQLLPEKRNKPDASLDWIIKSAYANKKLENNKFFDLIIDPKNSWRNTEFEYPSNYYIEVEGDTLTKLYGTAYEAPEWLHKKATKGFLVYYAHNHYRNKVGDSLQISDNNGFYKVYQTSHGVIVKKGNLHKWIFISDISITGAPDKLRWESIQMTKLYGKYLFIQQDLPPSGEYKLFVLNIETGICGRLKYDFSNADNSVENQRDTSLFQGESIIINTQGEQVTYKLKNIFKELETQYITKKKRN